MIESVGPEAAAVLAALHAQAFPRPWTAPDIAKLLENPAVFAITHGRPQAQGFAMGWTAAGDAELLTVAVVPAARRRGLGAALVTAVGVAALVRGAASMHLEVADDNEGARALYEKLGYKQVGRRPAYYAGARGPVDAIVMRRTLPRPIV